MLFSHERSSRVSELKSSIAIDSIKVLSITEILEDTHGLDHYPFEKTFDEIEDKVAFIIHSSGTTGIASIIPP